MGKAENMTEKALTIKDDNGNYIISENEYFEMSDYAEKLEKDIVKYREVLEEIRTMGNNGDNYAIKMQELSFHILKENQL